MKTDQAHVPEVLFTIRGGKGGVQALVAGSTPYRSRSNSFLIDRALRLGPASRQWCAGGLCEGKGFGPDLAWIDGPTVGHRTISRGRPHLVLKDGKKCVCARGKKLTMFWRGGRLLYECQIRWAFYGVVVGLRDGQCVIEEVEYR